MAKRKLFDDYVPVPAGPTVSETLRDARIAMGHELRDVASMLRIRYPYLQAIEDGRFQDLPGAAYAAGFLRSYAEYLGLDPESIVARYKEEAAGALRQQELYLPTPATEERVPGGTLLLMTLVLGGIVYGGWYYLSATDRSMADLVPALPDRLVSLLDTLPFRGGAAPSADPAPPAVSQSAPQQTAALPSSTAPVPAAAPSASVAAPPPVSPATTSPPLATPLAAPAAPAPAPAGASSPVVAPPLPPAKPPAVAALPPSAAPVPQTPAPAGVTNVPPPPAEDDDEGSPQEPTPLAAAPPPAAPAPRPAEAAPANPNAKVYGLQYQNVRLVLKATQESWLQIRDGSEIVFTRVLKPGDTYRVPDKAGVRVRTGNAGGLVVVADGAESGPLGSVGQVLRDVSIDAHGVVRPAGR
ncbi:cytoskeletal protein RodZ [Azospirillum agricola]|uniref:helix-turn-helix domain-containing protein n=1 Tax=Azospirillum agricola TaxID=1720247 RepID=UPI001AE7C703|nr:helix-turn-helix domain-containing protein [Azospirillum agricola]MBP2228326.1 cytoskeletal protein RodZ [Azospirillum agricola]